MAELKTVMISSTMEDLREHREQARDACLMLEFWPKMMEYLPAMDADGVAASLALVEDADLYVGIFANRYGTVPQGFDASITEMEYQRSVERGIPRLIFVANDSHAASLAGHDQRDAMQGLRERILKERVVSFFNSPEDLRARLVASLLKYRPKETSQFSEPIIDELTSLNRAITKLTAEQYKVLDFLRGHRRVAIKGCAGSGKTLVAAEKAIRLYQESKRVLILCHNPFLAKYIRGLVAATHVQVRDFSAWVHDLAGEALVEDWTHYEEPTEQILSAAFDHLLETGEKYDAVIVDEGQDFREEWWLLVEAALADPQTGILYIFHDDNQVLLGRNLRYPVTDAPLLLSLNCRNAGKIFTLVREFHPDAPQTSPDLQRKGIIRPAMFRPGTELETVRDSVRQALEDLPEDQLVVLTTEPDPVEMSILNELEIDLPQPWKWQDVLTEQLYGIAGRFHYDGPLPKFGSAPFPTQADIEAVCEWAVKVTRTREARDAGVPTPDRVKGVRWLYTANELNLPPRTSRRTLLEFFTEPTWADSIPAPEMVTLRPAWQSLGPGEVGLSTVASYKGLESDGVILFVRSPKDDLEATLYVGASRARYLLHLIIHADAMKALPFMPRNVLNEEFWE